MDYREQPSFDSGSRSYPHGPLRRWPPGVKWLILINAGVYLIEMFLSAASRANPAPLNNFFSWFSFSPADLFQRGFVWQLVTYAFLHDPYGIMHILFNMLFLYWFGRDIERVWGTRRFLIFYLAAAVFAALMFAVWHYSMGSRSGCIGASGAVMAVVMVYALWWPNQIILLFFFIPMRIRTFVMLTVVISTFSLMNVRNDVAHMAHLGGLLFGYLVIRFGPWLALRVATTVRESADRVSAEEDRRLDEILDKVHRKGIQSLSRGEKRFLKKMSERQ